MLDEKGVSYRYREYTEDPLTLAELKEAGYWQALRRAHLEDHVRNLGSGGLDALVKEGGVNFSVGQRQ